MLRASAMPSKRAVCGRMHPACAIRVRSTPSPSLSRDRVATGSMRQKPGPRAGSNFVPQIVPRTRGRHRDVGSLPRAARNSRGSERGVGEALGSQRKRQRSARLPARSLFVHLESAVGVGEHCRLAAAFRGSGSLDRERSRRSPRVTPAVAPTRQGSRAELDAARTSQWARGTLAPK
jgi:hypothetical protein